MELLFFPFLFSSYCRSVGLRVVTIVSCGCYQSFSALFYIVFELYRCVNVVFNAGKSSSSLQVFNTGKVLVPSFRFLWFSLSGPPRQQSPLFGRLSFLIIITRFGLRAGIRSCVCISKSARILCVSFCRLDSCFYMYHLVVLSNFNFLHNSQWITFTAQSCLVFQSL